MPAQTAAQKRRQQEQRQQRVEKVRAVEQRLGELESVLLAVVARAPALVREVQDMRAELRAVTAQPSEKTA